MTFGLDYVSGPPIADMHAAGVTFVCRYLSEVNAQTVLKILTAGEAKMLSEAGIAIVSNYEWYATRALEGASAGVADAHIAASQHAACGGEANRPIYFSVDVDVDGAQVADYFKGVASVIGLARTGAYGSYRVLKALFDDKLITWGWQTYAWSGGEWEARAHIQQYQNGVVLAGHSVDYDRSTADDFGQWKVGGGSMIPQGWTDDGHQLRSPNGVPIVLGMRDFVLSHSWDKDNWALAPESSMAQLEASNKELGGGSQQVFRWTMLAYTPERGVFVEWIGVELAYQRAQYASLYAAYQKLQAAPAPAQVAPPVDQRIAQYAAKLAAVNLLLTQAQQAAAL